jgi:hypothetical protein
MPSSTTISGKQRIAGLILIFLPGLALTLSSIPKLLGVHAILEEMASNGFTGNQPFVIGTLEIFTAALFLIPRTRSIR